MFKKVLFSLFLLLIPVGLVLAFQDPPTELPTLPQFPTELMGILSVLLPVVIQLINRSVSNKKTRMFVAFGGSLGVGVGAAALAGLFKFGTPVEVTLFIGGIAAFTQVAFHLFWKPLIIGNSNKLNSLFGFFSDKDKK